MAFVEPLFLAIGRDGPEAARVRTELLAAHLAYVERNMERYRIAGPTRDADGRMNASVLIVAAENEAAARALIMGDPYFASGMYQSVEIAPFRAAAGTWVGGRNW